MLFFNSPLTRIADRGRCGMAYLLPNRFDKNAIARRQFAQAHASRDDRLHYCNVQGRRNSSFWAWLDGHAGAIVPRGWSNFPRIRRDSRTYGSTRVADSGVQPLALLVSKQRQVHC